MTRTIEFWGVMLRLTDGRQWGADFEGTFECHKGQILSITLPTYRIEDRTGVRDADLVIDKDHWLWVPLTSALKQTCAGSIAEEARASCLAPHEPSARLSHIQRMAIYEFL